MRLDSTLIKQKIDEASKETWELIAKKALESGIEDGTGQMWLFFNRVNNSQYSKINGVRMKALAEGIGEI